MPFASMVSQSSAAECFEVAALVEEGAERPDVGVAVNVAARRVARAVA
jgi:hypothetical protein